MKHITIVLIISWPIIEELKKQLNNNIMSTTFGIKIETTKELVEVARRHSIGNGKIAISIKNDLVHLLPKETPLIVLDNTPQGINTVNDLLIAWKDNQ